MVDDSVLFQVLLLKLELLELYAFTIYKQNCQVLTFERNSKFEIIQNPCCYN